ncbi:DNA-binding MarR family transcriptional regulator [Peribacillus deserti]|uniref:DNA-binding MarR family transcriptional regulator n=1 Tax=Peribacillus deserti TaxID=673318 RepID=A0ABS2QH93_9BACI|nr:MarR family transcriptional regulator [Peribacillus deserti]MBM7692514.1 DNA-binding MarR family transcriptional regulator [Peribacillus deserti]
MRKDKINELVAYHRNFYRTIRSELQHIYGNAINGNEFSVLRFLYIAGPQKASAISQDLKVSASHITNVTDILVKKGYITRKRTDNDRRIVKIALTKEGEELYQEMAEKRSVYFNDRFKIYSEDELNTFIQLYKKMEQ